MKVLLLKPINDVYYTIQPSLGLGYVASIMLHHGHDVVMVHAGKERLTWEKFAAMLRAYAPDLVGIQMLSHEFLAVARHIEIIKRQRPETVVIVGGAHISGDPFGTMAELPELDYGFAGEAEVGLEQFLALSPEAMRAPASPQRSEVLREIPNLVWRRDDGQIVVNTRQKPCDLDAIDLPAWHLMQPANYPIAPHGNFCQSPPIAPLITTRGCPFPCTFCAGHNVTSRQVRFRSPENVMREIELLYHNYGVREIHIEDEVFTLKKSYAAEICNRLIASKMKLSLALPNGVRLDSLDEEILRLLERAGFYSIGVGVESGSDRILKLMRKHVTTDVIRRQVALIKRATSMNLTGFFIMGYPSETEAEIRQTIRFACELALDKANFMFLSPLPGSEVWEEYAKRNGGHINWANTFSYRVMEGMSDISPARMRHLHRKAVWDFYARPRILLNLARQVKSRQQLTYVARRLKNIFR